MKPLLKVNSWQRYTDDESGRDQQDKEGQNQVVKRHLLLRRKLMSGEEEVRVAVVNEKAEKENTEKEATKKESTENIVNASEFVGAIIDKLENDGAKPVKDAKVTSEEHHNSLEIMVYTRPLKVTPPAQEATDDTETTPKTEE
ncbi:hypothetical protein PVK06_009000 [Gossypium arboreum]|uniref:Uncharacterized protein n=1 Tax=Gossypium arboreum TaxID=29729 RepID=A0ABR0QMB2_GOSAR|nr:hypothetical protein PVK06_009000 [Gossypium arboreum]